MELPRQTNGRLKNQVLYDIPDESVHEAAMKVAQGASTNFGPSTDFDLLFGGRRLAPKAVLGLAGELHYGTTFGPKDFSGGEGTPCFARLRGAGYAVVPKASTLEKPRHWWVNHKQTVEEEISGGYIWSPKKNRMGTSTRLTETSLCVSRGT